MSKAGWESNWGWIKEETGFELCSAVSIELLNFLTMGKKHYESYFRKIIISQKKNLKQREVK